ncbi:hypothetical protein [Bathymodiolus japonicus methanotrophic gill symbiont]|uniref:hypothetical protein n=1 Tax=Bathymodiolus japonicus methanotrophic gill symbiont TaxID=113269 RepID=UPI001C8DF4D6|nr:hypothetical protein [Bathymodiolus japonicus methanotrophic gill symbiont]
MATTNGSTAIRDKILASLARYRALRIGKFPCAFWRLSSRPGLTATEDTLIGSRLSAGLSVIKITHSNGFSLEILADTELSSLKPLLELLRSVS